MQFALQWSRYLYMFMMAIACVKDEQEKFVTVALIILYFSYVTLAIFIGVYILPENQTIKNVLIGHRGIIICTLVYDIGIICENFYPSIGIILQRVSTVVYVPFGILTNVAKSGHLDREYTVQLGEDNEDMILKRFIMITVLSFVFLSPWYASVLTLSNFFLVFIVVDHWLTTQEKYFTLRNVGGWIYDYKKGDRRPWME